MAKLIIQEDDIIKISKEAVEDLLTQFNVNYCINENSIEFKTPFEKMANSENVDIELSDKEFNTLAEMAHKQNITFNELCNNILREQIENIEDDEEFIQELAKEKSGE